MATIRLHAPTVGCESVNLCYAQFVRNITVSVPEDIYRIARIRAAERGRSVSALVSEYLRSLSRQDAEFERLAAQERDVLDEITRFRAGDRLGRDALHARAVR